MPDCETMNTRHARLLWVLFCAAVPMFGRADAEGIRSEVVGHYARLVHANYEDALSGARALSKAVQNFVASPTPASLAAAKQAWLAARVPYLQTEVCRFYDGPIEEVEPMVNAWPMDEYFVDYVEGMPTAGIIQSVKNFPQIDRETIIGMNEREGEKCITLGFHTIEFLLWGQDFNADGPGERPVTDYIIDGSKDPLIVARRRSYLTITADLLVEHLARVVAAWAPDEAYNYRARFLGLPTADSLALILRGAGSLAGPELSGERLTVAYETRLQEDEHSCFSDNTHNDFRYDTLGLQNVFLGRYQRPSGDIVKGPGILDLLLAEDAETALMLSDRVAAAVAAGRQMPRPFDQAILADDDSETRVALKRAIEAFHELSRGIAEAGHKLGLKLRF